MIAAIAKNGSIGTFFAPWVRQLEMKIQSGESKLEKIATLNCNENITHKWGIVCGQALFGAADTLMVAALADVEGITGTLQSNITFLKPVKPGDNLQLHAKILHIGSKTCYGVVDFRVDDILVVQSTTSFARNITYY